MNLNTDPKSPDKIFIAKYLEGFSPSEFDLTLEELERKVADWKKDYKDYVNIVIDYDYEYNGCFALRGYIKESDKDFQNRQKEIEKQKQFAADWAAEAEKEEFALYQKLHKKYGNQ